MSGVAHISTAATCAMRNALRFGGGYDGAWTAAPHSLRTCPPPLDNPARRPGRGHFYRVKIEDILKES